MKLVRLLTSAPPRWCMYKLMRAGVPRYTPPITLTHSITAACQSRCKTCHIGSRYLENPGVAKGDLSLEEIERTYASIGPVFFYNISGGEPFLREDLPGIVACAMKHLKPAIVHIPTNGILSEKIHEKTGEILTIMKGYDPRVPLSVKSCFRLGSL